MADRRNGDVFLVVFLQYKTDPRRNVAKSSVRIRRIASTGFITPCTASSANRKKKRSTIIRESWSAKIEPPPPQKKNNKT